MNLQLLIKLNLNLLFPPVFSNDSWKATRVCSRAQGRNLWLHIRWKLQTPSCGNFKYVKDGMIKHYSSRSRANDALRR